MTQTIQPGDIVIAVTRKDIKHVHLSVHPPAGRVTLVALVGTRLDHRRITLSVGPGSNRAKREDVMQEWGRGLLHATVPALIQKWEPKFALRVADYFLQPRKTKWAAVTTRRAIFV